MSSSFVHDRIHLLSTRPDMRFLESQTFTFPKITKNGLLSQKKMKGLQHIILDWTQVGLNGIQH